MYVKLRLRRYIIKYTAAPSSHRIISAVGHCLPQLQAADATALSDW